VSEARAWQVKSRDLPRVPMHRHDLVALPTPTTTAQRRPQCRHQQERRRRHSTSLDTQCQILPSRSRRPSSSSLKRPSLRYGTRNPLPPPFRSFNSFQLRAYEHGTRGRLNQAEDDLRTLRHERDEALRDFNACKEQTRAWATEVDRWKAEARPTRYMRPYFSFVADAQRFVRTLSRRIEL
jgi:hypothetical protein